MAMQGQIRMTTTATSVGSPVTVFYSYAREDEPLRDELQGHLKILERRGLVAPWHDRKIVAGGDYSEVIDEQLNRAEMVLLLVSKDFIQSDYIMSRELNVAMTNHAQGRSVVVPVFVRAVDLQPEDAEDMPFLKLQGLPTDLRPVSSWPNRDEAWTNVAKGLRRTVHSIRERRRQMPVQVTPPARPAEPDPLLQQVTRGVIEQVAAAQRTRGAPLDQAGERALLEPVQRLIDQPAQRRILWVDDHPDHNRFETASLAKLQIEVVSATSTDAALAALEGARSDGEPFDLIISDWSRPWEGREAGLKLLRRMRNAGHAQPVVYYHGEFDPARRARRSGRARAAGALGEAVLPQELIDIVYRALGE